MKKREMPPLSDQPALQIKPLISYPRVAEAGAHYLLTIDVQLTPDSPWPYEEEEFEISFLLQTAPFFTHEPYGEDEPGLVLHRFGGTYGPAEYLLTASQQAVPAGKITIMLLNGWGVPIAHLDLDCEVKEEALSKTSMIKFIERDRIASSSDTEKNEFTSYVEQDMLRFKEERDHLIQQQLLLAGWNVLNAQDITAFPSGSTFPSENIFPGITVPQGNIALWGYLPIGDDYLLIVDREVFGYTKSYPGSEQIPDSLASIGFPNFIEKTNFVFKNFRDWSGQVHQAIPFIYHTTGYETIFRNYFEPGLYSRKVYTFHQPSTLSTWLKQADDNTEHKDVSFRSSLLHLPNLEQKNLRDYQFAAIQQIEQSMATNHTRVLIQMETNAGKTHTAIHSIHRLIAHAHAKHILYVIDVPLAKQYALNSFQRVRLPEGLGRFIDVYKVDMITNEKLDPSVHVYIGTLGELYNLYSSGPFGERLPQPAHRGEITESSALVKEYCASLPIEYFDVIFLAESEHINYQTWLPLLDYFDTFYIGIADTVSERVLRFFDNNLVYSASPIFEDAPHEPATPSPSLKNVQDRLLTDAGLSDYTDRLGQFSWLLLLKYLDGYDAEQAELDRNYKPIIAPGYRWRDWAQSLTDEPLLTFIDDQLIPYLANLRGESLHDLRALTGTIFRDTHNRCRSGSILRSALDLLDMLDLRSRDTLQRFANEYELLLQEAHFTSWDAGEYYTPRPIIRFMIDRLQPRPGESLLDPSCGTAGLLIEAYERLKNRVRNPEQWRALQANLLGIEKEPFHYLLGAVNMLLHGIEVPNIQKHNTLTTTLQQFRDADYVDMIAAHFPFSGREKPGTIYPFSSDTHTTETDQLFLQYCMAALKRQGGRAALVLANRVLSDRGEAASVTRRRLLTHFNLHTIIRLPDGVFAPYAGIPTAILFFKVGSSPSYSIQHPCTQEVWYYEIPLPAGQKRFSEKFPIRDEDFAACLAWWDQRAEHEHAWRVSSEWLFAHDCDLDQRNPRRHVG